MNDEKKINVLQCLGLTKTFTDGNQKIAVLNDINLTIRRGEQVAILGASGSGKSTLLHLLAGLDTSSAGKVWIANRNITRLSENEKSHLRNHYLGFIYQFHHLLPEFTVLENVSIPLLIRGEDSIQAIEKKAKQLLFEVGLEKRLQHRMGELSGGERQRVALARALVTQPVCVLADEPTGNLDNKTATQVYELMQTINRHLKTSFIVVTHDQGLAKRMDRVLTLENGEIVGIA